MALGREKKRVPPGRVAAMIQELRRRIERLYKDFLKLIPFDDPQSQPLVKSMIQVEKHINDTLSKTQEIFDCFLEMKV